MTAQTSMKPQWTATTHFRFNFYGFSSVCQSYLQEMPKVAGMPFHYGYEHLDILYDENDFSRHAQDLRDHPGKIKTQIAFLQNASAAVVDAARRYGTQKSVGAFNQWHRAYVKFLPSMGLVIGLERVLTEQVRAFLGEREFVDVSVARETRTAQEQKALLRLAAAAGRGGVSRRDIAAHCKKYGWLGNKFMMYRPISEPVFRERMSMEPAEAEKRLIDLKKHRRLQLRKCKTVLTKLTRGQRRLVAMYRDLLYWRTARAEANALAYQLTMPLFGWLAEFLGMSREALMQYSASEIVALYKTGIRPVPTRRLYFYAYFVQGVMRVFWGADGRKSRTVKPVSVFGGMVANRGKYAGPAVLVFDAGDLRKVTAGSVLVAPATNPDMIAAMEKAGAVVTDTGSMTSHAAIISRELDVPCIVAARIATKVLHDGDMVEVDADAGVVRRL